MAIKGLICLPGNPLPEEKELGRHPQVKPILVEEVSTIYYCSVCQRRFIVSNRQ